MFHKYNRFIELILFLTITGFTPAVLAEQPATVKQSPQSVSFKIAQSNPDTPPGDSSLEDLSKVNTSLKKDINVLVQQVNKLSNEINELKTGKSESSDFQQILQDNWEAVSFLFGLILLIFLLISFLIFYRLRNDSKRSIQTNIEKMISNTKTEILKEFKINETDFHAYITRYSAQKLEDFNETLINNYNDFNLKVQDSLNTEINQLKENIAHLITRRLDKFTFELENKFEESKLQLVDEMEKKLPAGDLNAVILKLAEDKGLFDKINAQMQNSVSEILTEELEKIDKYLENKETSIIADIQKIHLANNHFNIGNIFVKNKHYTEAVEEFNEAIRIDPNFYGAYINLGKVYEIDEQFNEAIEVYKKAIQVRPEHYKSYFNLGNLYNRLEMHENAIEAYKAAIELKPDYSKLYNNIGITYEMLNMFEEAKESYEKAIDFNNEYADAYLNLSKVEAQLEKNEDIFSIAEKYLKKYNASKEIYSTVKELVVLQS